MSTTAYPIYVQLPISSTLSLKTKDPQSKTYNQLQGAVPFCRIKQVSATQKILQGSLICYIISILVFRKDVKLGLSVWGKPFRVQNGLNIQN
jgi:hypothetical protein